MVPIGTVKAQTDVVVLGYPVEEYRLVTNPPKLPINWRFWLGATVNKYGVGPKMDLEGRQGRWGIKLGISIPVVPDYKCARGALFCPQSQVIEDTQSTSQLDLMFSWTK